jgi:hypothetical protein
MTEPNRPTSRARLSASRNGNVAVIVAVVLPVLAVLSAGATELAFVWTDRGRLQDAADSAALAGASQLAFGSEASVIARAESQVAALTKNIASHATVDPDAVIIRQNGQPAGVQVEILSVRPSFFGDLLPPGGFRSRVTATAMSMSGAPLCVFGVSDAVVNGINVAKGKLQADGCVVHSNYSIDVGGGSQVKAALTQAVGAVSGPAPNIRNGAEKIDDPFKNLNTAPANWLACATSGFKVSSFSARTLVPGVHCGVTVVEEGATMTLQPGTHYFRNSIEVKKTAKIVGNNATMVLGPDFILKLDENDNDPTKVDLSKINVKWDLYGAKTGPMAGFVLVVDRARTKPLKLPAKMVDRLEGVAYFPTTSLEVYGLPSDGGADDSNWTVLVGRELQLTLNASIMLHTDYSLSDVPVPTGVGNKAGSGGGGQRLSD